MYQRKIERELRCPLEYGLDIFGGKWNSRIICILFIKGSLRYNELKAEMLDITDTVLSRTLKELMQNNMVERRQYNELPMHVTYQLTEKAESVILIFETICQWSKKYLAPDDINNSICGQFPKQDGEFFILAEE
ncbi:HxlR family transcriptional regulator [Streptococcus anginosus]|uniref:winged helix-turn-helix transcriptional regulator n=1 Tax=Streptococcus anginosus TaxID=1328 RepID=UPI0001F6040C|nr:helix-turn-helix domain-containing protein [Streptococcus anginosus]EFW07739.1 HxlR family Transcriptional regulator [Streptococcus anginosus 1_2_62CV]MCW0997278.1 helix-turn-helix transcriptional regulator [Streptococcus anginosus]MCW1052589.1 helix-turn-helix transcriptional regulator [Streptococcus anginosus]MCW1066937.1 helix-turn-helix transcriptional regulator [Streptococcus anginosus]VTS26646.1 HxlR family transcriptional regulator [Streptococcus anginosus]